MEKKRLGTSTSMRAKSWAHIRCAWLRDAEGSEIVRTKPVPFVFPDNVSPSHLAACDRMTLGPRFVPGDYALQIVVTDNLAKRKNSVAFQSIDFAVAPPESVATPIGRPPSEQSEQ